MDDPERLRKLKERLLRMDAEVSALFDSAHDLVCEFDAHGLFQRLNPRWRDQLGYSLSELQARSWTEFIHPDDLALTSDALTKLQTEDTVQFENRLRHSNGSYRSLSWTATRWPAPDLTLAVAADVTQRREDERALHELRRFEQQVIETAYEGIVMLDREFRFVAWNPFMERISGLPAKHVLGKCAPEIFPVPPDQGEYDMVRRALDGETVASPDLRYDLPRTGSAIWITARFSPYRSEAGEIIGAIAFVQEITDRKRIEQELHEARRLEKRSEVKDRIDSGNVYGLTPRERSILGLLADGKSNKEIAQALSISPVTVSSHVRSILRKMHAASRAEAAARAVREALVN